MHGQQARPGVSGCGVLVAILIAFVATGTYLGIHQVKEGHIGVYWRGGALLNSVTEPGYHAMIPFVTTSADVQVSIQTDMVQNIPCGTSGGVMIYFEKIEVVNRLKKDHVHSTVKHYGLNYDRLWIFDKVHHEINQFCSKHSVQEVYIDLFDKLDEAMQALLQADCDKWDTGIDIVSIRVTKPKIPESLARQYLEVNEEKTKLLVAQQHQVLIQKEEETKRMTAIAVAQKEADVSAVNSQKEATVAIIAQQRDTNVSVIRMEKEVREKEAEAKKQLIQTEMELKMKEAEAKRIAIDTKVLVERQRAIADSNAYAMEKEAAALKLKLTPEYLRLVLYQSLANTTKVYFGPSIPHIFLDWTDDDGSLTLKSKH